MIPPPAIDEAPVLARRSFIQALIATVCWPGCALRAEPSANLRIVVEGGEWGNAVLPDIRKVAESAAGEIWKFCGQSRMDVIRVYHRKDLPQTDFRRGPEGQIGIGLAVEHQRWSQFAFQFAHEFCHALVQPSEVGDRGGHQRQHPNLWLEECLCETGSLFAVRRMAETWRVKPPYPNWRDYAPAHARYVEERLGRREHQLPDGMSFREWFSRNVEAMRRNAALRDRNVIVAAQLLPLLEAAPEHWEAVTFLNHGQRAEGTTLVTKLAEWRSAAPRVHQEFIARIGAVLGVNPGG